MTEIEIQEKRPETSEPSAPSWATREFRRLEEMMDRLANRAWPENVPRLGMPDLTSFWERHPRVDIVDREEEWLLLAELPGVQKDALELSVTDEEVRISAQRPVRERGKVVRREIPDSLLERTVALPGRVLSDQASAKLQNGILEVRLPKAAASVSHTITPK